MLAIFISLLAQQIRLLDVLHPLSPFLDGLTGLMGEILGFVHDLVAGFLDSFGRGIYFVFCLVLQIVHALSPSTNLIRVTAEQRCKL